MLGLKQEPQVPWGLGCTLGLATGLGLGFWSSNLEYPDSQCLLGRPQEAPCCVKLN